MKNAFAKKINKEHKIMNNILDEIEDQLRIDSKTAKDIFKVFFWNLEKHIFIEEKVFFSAYSVWQDENEILELIKEHRDLLYLMKNIETDLLRNRTPDITTFREVLDEHFRTEEEILYPIFEEVLDDNQKELLLDRTQEVIVG